MKNLFITLIALCMISCTKEVLNEPPLHYSFLPEYLDVDSIQPLVSSDTNTVVDTSYKDFVSIPVEAGILKMNDGSHDTIPAGVLISDRKAALYSFYRSSWIRQQTELKYTKQLMHSYYSGAKNAEILYQDEIKRLRKECQRSWLEKNMGYIGFGIGALTIILVNYSIFYGGFK